MTTAPIERILQRLPAVSQVAVYAVPDEQVGDQVMAALVLADNAELTPGELGEFLAGRPPVAQGLAAPRLDHRQPAVHRHQQNPQARTERPALRRRMACCGPASGATKTYVVVDQTASTVSHTQSGEPAAAYPSV